MKQNLTLLFHAVILLVVMVLFAIAIIAAALGHWDQGAFYLLLSWISASILEKRLNDDND